jgi:hypothetical protein
VLDQDSTVLGKGGTGDDNVSGLLSDLTSGQQVREGESDGKEEDDTAHDRDGYDR